ncbi:carbohydrate-binding family 9-like protein [Pedobacter sp. MW01-1-1]|uniref:carbohydrate-binding family 9-like protein n=1 Tax=Pedobacter sp. MW01-1-1 TaxID=3383027 RepID=UPI003FF0E247
MVSKLLDTHVKNAIQYQPWPAFQSNCQTSVAIVHSGDAIFLKFYVKEDVIKVKTHQINGPVHQDNCVEFFVLFKDDDKYFNIEFNCMGLCLIGYGKERLNRELLNEQLICKVKTHINIKSAAIEEKNRYQWEITAMLPIEIFEASNLTSFNQKSARGNFFKCGDDLPKEHFYSWQNIISETPDFHLPEFFGSLAFS